MSIREDPARPGWWIVDCRPGGYKGKRVRIPVNGTMAEAAEVERRLMRRHIDTVQVKARSIAAIWPAWLRYYRANRASSTVADAEVCWRHLKDKFGSLQPKALTRQLVEGYKQARVAAGVKPRTVNKELTYLSSMLAWAADNDLCDRLPFAMPKFPARMARAAKPRPLSPQQITAIFETIDPEYRLVFLLMADAGLRRNEALTLTMEQVEFDSGIIFVIGKGGKERIVPITTDRLHEELAARMEAKGWLTVNQETGRPFLSIRKALVRAAAKAGIGKHLHHHLLRHSFGTAATVAGYDLSALQAIMGHSSPVTTGLYQNLAGEYLRTQGRKMQTAMDRDKTCDLLDHTATADQNIPANTEYPDEPTAENKKTPR